MRQIRNAQAPLQSKHVADPAVHTARKQIKMARATLRLLRKGLSHKTYRTQNERLRDAARPLSEARDATVLLSTLDGLVNGQGRERGAGLEGFRDELARERARIRSKITGDGELAQSRRLLRQACRRAAHWKLGGEGWAVVGEGLAKVYVQGRDALATVRKTPTNPALHEWRKQVKYLRHQLRLLQPIEPDTVSRMVEELRELGDHLGDDHDLAVLQIKMAARSVERANAPAQRRLNDKINRRRLSLQRRALELGSRLYADTPRQFRSRLLSYWRAWRRSLS